MEDSIKVKYSIACPTLGWIGYDLVRDPLPILEAIKAGGFDGADLPVEGVQANKMLPILQRVGLEVPEIMGTWGYAHSGKTAN